MHNILCLTNRFGASPGMENISWKRAKNSSSQTHVARLLETYQNSIKPWWMSRAIKSPVKSSRSPVSRIIPSKASGRNSMCSCNHHDYSPISNYDIHLQSPFPVSNGNEKKSFPQVQSMWTFRKIALLKN